MSCELSVYAMAHDLPLVKAALSATGVVAVACIALLGFGPLAASPLLSPYFQWDVWWTILYACCASTIAGLVWVRRGTLLLLLTGLCLLTLLLIPIVCADIGLAFGGLIWIGVLAASAGSRLLRWLTPGLIFSPAEQFVFATILGYGGLSFLTLSIALLQILTPPYLVGALVGITLLLWRDFLRTGQHWWTTRLPMLRSVWQTHDLRLPAGIFAAGTVCFFGAFVWAIAPAMHHDALSYHLAVPQIYANHGGLITVHEEFRAYWIHNAEMLYTFGLVLVGQPLPSLLHCSCGLLLTGLVFTFGRRIGGPRLGLLAAGMLYAIPIITWESGSAYIDLAVGMYTFGTVYAVTLCWLEQKTQWLTLTGLLSGLAIGTKLNAALILLPIGVFTLFLVWTLSTDWRERGKALLRAGLPAVLISAPWFVLEWIRTGSPIFPFYNNYFKSPLWPPENPSFNFSLFGMGSELVDWFRLPWDLTLHTAAFGEGSVSAFAGLPILGLPLCWLMLRGDTRKVTGLFFACLCLSSALWFHVAKYYRYFIPFLPLLVCIAALNIVTLWDWIETHNWKRSARVGIVIMGLVWLTGTRWTNIAWNFYVPERYPYTLALGLENSRDFLSRNLGIYSALRYLADISERDEVKVFSVGTEYRLYNGRARMYDIVGSLEGQRLARLISAKALAEALEQQHFTHLLRDERRLQHTPGWASVAPPDFLRQYTQLEFTRNRVYVYRFSPHKMADADSASENMLDDSGFERVNPEEVPYSWLVFGAPDLAQDSVQARTGMRAVRVSQEDGVYQRVIIQPHEIYTMDAYIRAAQKDQTAWMQVMWLDQDLQFLGGEIVPVAAAETWKKFQISAMPPEAAVYAQVYARAAEGSIVWFDDIAFRHQKRGP